MSLVSYFPLGFVRPPPKKKPAPKAAAAGAGGDALDNAGMRSPFILCAFCVAPKRLSSAVRVFPLPVFVFAAPRVPVCRFLPSSEVRTLSSSVFGTFILSCRSFCL